MTGTIFSIEEFATFDGPGVRTTVFFKGCPLTCTWCHNPEGQSPAIEYRRSLAGCISCGACLSHAKEDAQGEKHFTLASARACPKFCILASGETLEADELAARVLKNAPLLQEMQGGVTFSGGEPLTQPDFLVSVLEKLEGKLHRAIETCGYADSTTFARVLARCDYMLFDLKPMDDSVHRDFCGVSNQRILENFRTLVRSGVPFVTRVPLIPGVTDTADNVKALATLLSSLDVRFAELLPYNRAAGAKYTALLRTYAPRFDVNADAQTHVDIFRAFGIETNIM